MTAPLPLTLPLHHVKCRHWAYLMTCDEFDALYGEGTCQICGADEIWALTRCSRPLYIDHWGGPPNWQVRGLLCLRCNTRLADGSPFNGAARSYVDNSYWRRELVPLIPQDEPASGVAHFRWRQAWQRGPSGWHARNFQKLHRQDVALTWEQLCFEEGPPVGHAATSTDFTDG